MNQTTKLVIGLIIAVVVIIVGYSLSKGPEVKAPSSSTVSQEPVASAPVLGEPITIGFIGPLTGDTSSIGTVSKAAVEVATEEINKAGGINGRPLNVIYEDGQCNAKVATNAANKLINADKVPVIIGGLCSTETAAFAPMAMEKKVIVFSYASSAPSLSSAGKYFFRSYPSDAFQGKFAAEYAYNTLGAKKVAVAYHISEWGTGIKDVFEKRFRELGGTILGTEGAAQESRDYRTIMTKIKGLSADLIYMPMYSEGGVVAVKQARELGIKTKILGGDAWGDPKFQKEVSGKGDLLFTEPATPLTEEFKAKILARTKGDQVPLGTAQAYDNVNIVAEVMKKVGADTEKIQEEIRKITYAGVSGTITFDANGDITTAAYAVKKIQDGKAIEIQ